MQEPFAQLIERTFSGAERAVIYRLIQAPRQVRRFTTDPIPADTLLRVLDAALCALSGVDRRCWHTILITSSALRMKIVEALRASQGPSIQSLPDDSEFAMSRHLLLDRVTEAPVHLAVTYDLRSSERCESDPSSMPETAMLSSYMAIQNMWLAASAEGLGITWLDLSTYRAVARLLEVPSGVMILAYLCLGIPQELHIGPGAKTVGWHRSPQAFPSIYQDIWGEPHDLLSASSLSACEHTDANTTT